MANLDFYTQNMVWLSFLKLKEPVGFRNVDTFYLPK